jgi:HlyD family secretion protein
VVGRSWVITGIVAVGIAGFVYYRQSLPAEVAVTKATVADVKSNLAISGRLEANRRTSVASQLSGLRVQSVLVDVGDSVTAGQPLIQLDGSELDAQVQASDAQLLQAKAQQDAARSAMANASRSEAIARLADQEVNDLRAAVVQSKTNLNTSRQRLRQAEANLARTRVGGRPELVRQAEAQLSQAKATAQQRAREADRARRLLEEGAIAQQNAEQSFLAEKTAQENVRVAEEAVELARTPRPEDVRQAEAQRAEANAAMQGAQQSLGIAERSLNSKIATRQGLINAQNQMDTARSNLRVAEAGESVTRASGSQARLQREKSSVRAPFSGRIVERLVEPGQTVQAGVPLLRIADPNSLRVRVDVDEARIGLVRPGQKAIVSPDAIPDLRIPAEVAEISDAADFARGTIEVRLRLLGSDPRLRADLTVDANLEIATFDQAIVLPRQAILEPDKSPAVLRLTPDNTVERVDVKIARGDTGRVVVISGLNAGDIVILEPIGQREGRRVRPKLQESGR